MWPTLLAVLHLACLPCALIALLQRARSLSFAQSAQDLKTVFFWDNLYGVTALIWIATGMIRFLGGTDKATDYYLGNHVFWLKMLLVLAVLALEASPMVSLIRARISVKRAEALDIAQLRKTLLLRHYYQAGVIIVIVITASSMARGIGTVKGVGRGANGNLQARGLAIYSSECAHCHGMDGRGQGGQVAPDFVGDPTRLAKNNSQLLRSIEEGVPGTTMLGFGNKLTSADRRAVLDYIRTTYAGKQ
jgi:putative membrane protein